MALAEIREVVRCKHCRLNQYQTANKLCRRCKYPTGPQPILKVVDTPTEPLDETFVKPPEPQRGLTEEEFQAAMISIRGVTIG